MEKQENKMFAIDKYVLQQVVDYLATKPAAEVYNLITSLLALKEINLSEPKEEGSADGEK
jgi:hypothetical protein